MEPKIPGGRAREAARAVVREGTRGKCDTGHPDGPGGAQGGELWGTGSCQNRYGTGAEGARVLGARTRGNCYGPHERRTAKAAKGARVGTIGQGLIATDSGERHRYRRAHGRTPAQTCPLFAQATLLQRVLILGTSLYFYARHKPDRRVFSPVAKNCTRSAGHPAGKNTASGRRRLSAANSAYVRTRCQS